MFSLVREVFPCFSFLISNIAFRSSLHNTILFLCFRSFYHRYPISLLFFPESPRIRRSVVSCIVAIVGSITTRGSPEAYGCRSDRIRTTSKQNSIINSFSLFVISFIFFIIIVPFYSVHIVSKRTSVVSVRLGL